jgi:hypothetical protein
MTMKVYDPGGNEIVLRGDILRIKELDKPTDEIFDDISAVIEKPMMMFKKHTFPEMLYYLRAVGWSTIVLVYAKKNSVGYEVTEIEWNPSTEQIAEIYDNAERLI